MPKPLRKNYTMPIDIIFLCVLVFGFFLGFSKGIIRTIFSILAILLGVVAAFKLAPPMTKMLETLFNSESPLMFLAGAFLAFVLVWLAIRFIARFIEGLLVSANLNIINQILGGALMAVILLHLFSYLVTFGESAGIVSNEIKRESRTYAYIKEFPGTAKRVYDFIEPSIKEFWDETVEFLDRMEDVGVERSEEDANIFDIEDDEPAENPPPRREVTEEDLIGN